MVFFKFTGVALILRDAWGQFSFDITERKDRLIDLDVSNPLGSYPTWLGHSAAYRLPDNWRRLARMRQGRSAAHQLADNWRLLLHMKQDCSAEHRLPDN